MSAYLVTEAPGEPVIKTCGCRRTFTAAEWARLPFAYETKDDVERVEYRHCDCRSTIGIVLETYREDAP